jgi:predicted amidophosphoribosyltransferase
MENADQFWATYSFLRPYHPYKLFGKRNPAFTAADGLLLDLKEGNEKAIETAAQDIEVALRSLHFREPAILAIIPGHEAVRSNAGRPLQKVIEAIRLINPDRYFTACDLLTRHKNIPKRSHGSTDRSEDVHIKSLRTDGSYRLISDTLIIVDDVATTGNSIAASRKLATAFHYTHIGALVIGQTSY